MPRVAGILTLGITIMASAVVHVQEHGAIRFEGRRLTEALKALENRGLRIIYSSVTVRPDMRVRTEPQATSLRGVLDELLSPHGLTARDGPGGRILILRKDHTNLGAVRTTARPTRRVDMKIDVKSVRFLMCTVVLLCPSALFAQASIVGVVRDTSGGALPGVTVEASSPGLIEKVRTGLSDGTGQYRIIDLRPGTYTVTFTLPGFGTVRREGIELTGTFAATVNVDMRVGAIEETVTVTGEAPVVDVQSVRTQQTMDKDLIAAIPTARQFYNFAVLVPSVMVTMSGGSGVDVGGNAGFRQALVVAHGSARSDSRTFIDGLGIGGAGFGTTMFMTSAASTQEIVFSISGGMGEAQTAGPAVNIIPRDGGNIFSGTVIASGANDTMQSNNLSDDLITRGLQLPDSLVKQYDINPTAGGPIIRDRVWFYTNYEQTNTVRHITNGYYNLNAKDATKWTYEPDVNRPIPIDNYYIAGGLRMTWQAKLRNKFTASWDEQHRGCFSCTGPTLVTESAEALTRAFATINRVQQVRWTSPVSSRLLLESGWGGYWLNYGNYPWEENPPLISVTEQGGVIPGLSYRAPTGFKRTFAGSSSWLASASYVSGTHALKVGYLGQWNRRTAENSSYEPVMYRFNNGVPNQLTMSALPTRTDSNLWLTGLYAQDAWTRGRLTLQGGLRYDALWTTFPAQRVGPVPLMPYRIEFPEQRGLDFKDLTPRGGLSYDVFGNGKTAAKLTLGKYAQTVANGVGSAGLYEVNPLGRLAFSTTRAWNDVNRDFVADCDLLNRASNGECGAMANRNYGTTTFSQTLDDDVSRGWGNRPYQWEFSASVQQQLRPRLAANIGFFRRSFGNQAIADNLAVSASDYDRFTVTAPTDARLPGGGGQTVTAFDVTPSKFGLVDNRVRLTRNIGDWVQTWTGVDVTVNARLANGLVVQGGTSTGQSVTDQCDVARQVPEILQLRAAWTPLEYCRQASGFLTQAKGLATYTIPRWDVRLSGTFQSIPGLPPDILLAGNLNLRAGNLVVPNAVAAPLLGRNLAGNAANTTVNVVEPGSLQADRINTIDLRFSRLFRFGTTRTEIAVDMYNALNANPVLQYIETVGPRYLQPTAILSPRLFKVNVQFDF